MDEFVQSCLSDIGADHKVWVADKDIGNNELDIFVSAKSSVKPSIFDKKVWLSQPVSPSSFTTSRLATQVDGTKVYISFLKKGVSVFDLAGVVQEPMRNVDGFVVIPPSITTITASATSTTDYDEIPF